MESEQKSPYGPLCLPLLLHFVHSPMQSQGPRAGTSSIMPPPLAHFVRNSLPHSLRSLPNAIHRGQEMEPVVFCLPLLLTSFAIHCLTHFVRSPMRFTGAVGWGHWMGAILWFPETVYNIWSQAQAAAIR